jgi:DNA-binding MarR family transcriptional regulator
MDARADQRHPKFSSRDIVTEPLADRIDPDSFTPRMLALLSNALVWRESNELRRAFGLGTNDWRVLSALAMRPGAAATDVSDFLGMNKALISKSVNTLIARDLIVRIVGRRGQRLLYLTPDGAEMHHSMLPISLRGQEIIHAGLTTDEVAVLTSLLSRMLERIPDLQVAEFGPAAEVWAEEEPATSGRRRSAHRPA